MIHNTASVVNSTVSESSKIYKFAEVNSSLLCDHTSVGDYSILINSVLRENSAINRRNFIYRSEIGNFSYTGINTSIRSAIVGRFCSVSWDVSIGGGNHQMQSLTSFPLNRFLMQDEHSTKEDVEEELRETFNRQSACVIGNDVLISSNVTVLRGVEIGDGCVIGAGAVVNKSLEPYSIAVGVPARVIKKRFPEAMIKAVKDLQWWNWPKEYIRKHSLLIFGKRMDQDDLLKLQAIHNELKHSEISE